MTRAQRLSVIIPVYNEEESFPLLWDSLCAEIATPFEAYVVFDHDEDTTIPAINKVIAQGETRLRPLRNVYGRGVVGAIMTGINAVEDGAVVVVMADLSDDISQIDEMFALYRKGFDVVCGSRYSPGGRLIGGPWLKQTLSRVAGVSLNILRRFPTRDATNAFKLYNKRIFEQIKVESRGGFEFSLEVVVKAYLAGFSVIEIPTTWTDRISGKSKFKLIEWLPQYLRWYLLAFTPARARVADIAHKQAFPAEAVKGRAQQ